MNSFVETTNQQSTKNDLFWWKFLRHINIFIVFPTPWKEQIPKEVLDCWLYSKKVCPKTFLFLISRKNLWNESTNLIKICMSNYISGFHQQKLPDVITSAVFTSRNYLYSSMLKRQDRKHTILFSYLVPIRKVSIKW